MSVRSSQLEGGFMASHGSNRGMKAVRKTAGKGSRSVKSAVKEQGASLTSARKVKGSR